VVNDRFGADGVAITFCPLCGTGMAFRAGTAAKPVRFGVSGLLYNSDVLLYDRGTLSLWSQLLSKAVSGPLKGRHLDALPVMHTSWADWRARHPRTVVLSRDTGFPRDYGRDPYAAYAESERIMFPVGRTNRSLHPKERVIGISLGGRTRHIRSTNSIAPGRLAVASRQGGHGGIRRRAPQRPRPRRGPQGDSLVFAFVSVVRVPPGHGDPQGNGGWNSRNAPK